jgi:HEAT repeat protein
MVTTTQPVDLTEDQVLERIGKLSADEQPVAHRAYYELEAACYGAMNAANAARHAELAAILGEEVAAMVTPPPPADDPNRKMEPRPKYDRRTRNTLLQDIELRECGRKALQRIPGNAAVDALIEDFNHSVGTRYRIGVLNTLAIRGTANALLTIRQAINENEPELQMAAIDALAKFPEPSHDETLEKAAKCEDPRVRFHAIAARFKLAEVLSEAGKKNAAKAIYRSLAKSKSPAARGAKAILATM